METVIIKSKSRSNAELLVEMAKKMGDEAKLLSAEQSEDIALGLLMKKNKTGINVSKKTILKKLQ
jgi:4-hydroxy-3-methylbut-2-enyl diphosphate reductase IspH